MIKAIVTDIEGTTSSLSFVKDVLFPYARERLTAFVAAHGGEPEVAKLLDDARAEMGWPSADDAQVAEAMLRWIDEDRKATPLKALQGIIWEAGYRQGDFTGHLYDDADDNLRRWHRAGIRLYVYSSGSIHAQKLLFGHSDRGDLTPLFSGYFDTNVGGKREAASYRSIVDAVGLPAGEILFLSDIVEELDAAAEAGMATCWLVRDGGVDADARHRQVGDFNAIELDRAS